MKRSALTGSLLLLILGLLPGLLVQAQPATVPETAYINGMVGHAQSYNLSCESRSAADWAAFFGVSVSESEFLFNLPSSDNPDKGFVGNVNDPWGNTPPYSYGVHAEPVAQLLREYGLNATARRGLSWDDLRQEVGNGRPVIVWLIGSVWSGTAQVYTAADGAQTLVAPYEHTMILLGYDSTTVYLLNSASGLVEWHALSSFLTSWAVLGNMAVVAGEGGETAVTDDDAQIYIVQPGDSLLSIAARFGFSWYELAIFNNLATPDVIYAGQALRLPTPAQVTQPDPTPAPDPMPAPEPAVEASTKATYTVQRGEHLIQIARSLGLDWQAIARLNNLQPPAFVVYPQQVLQLPASASTAPDPDPEPDSSAVEPASYVVQQGDTLFKIATRFGLDWPTLAQLNGLSYPYRIFTGQTLRLR